MTITPRFWVPKHLLAEIAKLHIEERHALGRVIFATSWFAVGREMLQEINLKVWHNSLFAFLSQENSWLQPQ